MPSMCSGPVDREPVTVGVRRESRNGAGAGGWPAPAVADGDTDRTASWPGRVRGRGDGGGIVGRAAPILIVPERGSGGAADTARRWAAGCAGMPAGGGG